MMDGDRKMSEKINEDSENTDEEKHLPKTPSRFYKSSHIIYFVLISILTAYLFNSIDVSAALKRLLSHCPEPQGPNISAPRYWVPDDGSHLQVVHKIFNAFGFQRNESANDWDVLWSHQYPFINFYSSLKDLKPHQKVNHFPGCGYFTNKVDMSTSDVDFIPKSFRIPKDVDKLKKYAEVNPDLSFIVKGNKHRNVQITDINGIDLTKNDTFIQRFVDDPYLVDGHKFDIGVYTILTSIDPLTIYIYNGDVLFRYCPTPYHPFNGSDLDKYVIAEDYLPTWEVPSLKEYYKGFGYGMRDSFNAYVRNQGADPQKIWEQVESHIRNIILLKEEKMKTVTRKFKSTHNFFELYRFDFGVDENLDVFLMEANMSPNLSPAHFKPNQLLYEQVVFNVLNLVGVGKYILPMNNKPQDLQMVSANKNILVTPEICASYECSGSCASIKCSLCLPCLTSNDVQDLHKAYQDHMNRGDCRRVFPEKMTGGELSEDYLKKFSPKNQLIIKWFNEKCKADYSWC